MARKQKYDEGTRNRLLQVASDLIFEKGFDGTAIRNITDEAGCKVGLFYYYFKSKKDMLSAMMENFSFLTRKLFPTPWLKPKKIRRMLSEFSLTV